MLYENVAIKGDCWPIPRSHVQAVEQQLRARFPQGYLEYMNRFGEGVLGGSFIRVYPPQRVLNDLSEWRARIAEYWFWDHGAPVLSKAQALECIVFADTVGGDELVFHPRQPDEIFVLPRSSEDILAIGPGLPAAIEWCCGSGVLTEPFDERLFEAVSAHENSEANPGG
jgi:hypothetical protein